MFNIVDEINDGINHLPQQYNEKLLVKMNEDKNLGNDSHLGEGYKGDNYGTE